MSNSNYLKLGRKYPLVSRYHSHKSVGSWGYSQDLGLGSQLLFRHRSEVYGLKADAYLSPPTSSISIQA